MDVDSDIKLLALHRKNELLDPDNPFPVNSFQDLVDVRVSLLNLFRANPVCFLDAVGFVSDLSTKLTPQIIHVHPQGVRIDKKQFTEELISIHSALIHYPVLEQLTGTKKTIEDNITYAYWKPRFSEMQPSLSGHIDSWATVFSLFGPLYRGMQYGHKCRSMVEMDVVQALTVSAIENRIVWDPEYYHSMDVSSPDDYFNFYELQEAQCDLCSARVSRSSCVFVSSLTIKQNKEFVAHFSNARSPLFVLEYFLKSWAGWLICRDEATKWGFIK